MLLYGWKSKVNRCQNGWVIRQYFGLFEPFSRQSEIKLTKFAITKHYQYQKENVTVVTIKKTKTGELTSTTPGVNCHSFSIH